MDVSPNIYELSQNIVEKFRNILSRKEKFDLETLNLKSLFECYLRDEHDERIQGATITWVINRLIWILIEPEYMDRRYFLYSYFFNEF